ncbi:DM13 domain-containing protein [Pseudonocardia sp. H11422]|uniref:DM13 domain-containing protein n=1 Tax=Pseudonocardia sp. H11422 TaxID=2835866 RepID=UPI0027E30592|nr:DM13 domain-containing protein [Pseudonocardia sp. H11422]
MNLMHRTARRPLLRRPTVLVVLGLGLVVTVGALLFFQPWKLFVDQVVDEAAPGAVPAGAPVAMGEQSPVVLMTGDLISHEHATTGTVQVLRLSDGSRVLRLEDLDTSNGPLLKVWLTDAPVSSGRDGWFVFDDGRYVDLGDLKGNKGSSNYPIPADVDLSGLSSMSI